MKALITSNGQFGPFVQIARAETEDGWNTGDCFYPDNVVGPASIGEWVPPAPSAAELNAPLLRKIAELEAEGNTPRRIREAITTPEGMLWLAARNDEIKELRKELKK